MQLVPNLPLVGLWVNLFKIPKPYLYAGILIFATVGVHGMQQNAFDLFLFYAIGRLGMVMRRIDFPTSPVIIGMILSPLAEGQLRNAMSIGEGSAMVFVKRAVSLIFIFVVIAVLVLPRLAKRWSARTLRQGAATKAATPGDRYWANYLPLMASNSTSNTSVALGGITPPAPREP